MPSLDDFDKLLEQLGDIVETRAYGGPPNRAQRYDIEKFAYLIATYESARYFIDRLPRARNLKNRFSLLRYALDQAPREGLVTEFGVAEGGSLRYIAGQVEGTVYGFDSFEGLPEDWTHFQRKGRYDRNGQRPDGLPDNTEIIVGLFEDTLPDFVKSQRSPIRFAHIDCDIYSSTRTVLDNIGSLLQAGSVIVFDDYWNYPGWQQHQYKAFQEFINDTGAEYEYLGFVSNRWYMAVRITRL